jgi:hypothetical protein
MKRIVRTMPAIYEMALVCPRWRCAFRADTELDFGAQYSSPQDAKVRLIIIMGESGSGKGMVRGRRAGGVSVPRALADFRHERVFF